LRMATYAAMIEVMDQGLGRVFAALRELNLADNTIILFLSDNGASAEVLDQWPTPGPYSHTPGAECGTLPSHLCLEVGWANAANTPYREHKMWGHEGGIATPFIVKMPGQKQTGTPAWNRRVGHIVDLMPTFLELASATYPDTHRGEKTLPLPGRSLLPTGPGVTTQVRTIAWEHEGNRTIRQGKWKLVANYDRPWELYNLSRDPTELTDLAPTQPRRLRELSHAWQLWANEVGVVPWGNFPQSNYQPTKTYRRKSEPVSP